MGGDDQALFVPTGIDGLDDILRGGVPEHTLCLITGTPGTGKTTLAMQFLLAGTKRGEKCLYVTSRSIPPSCLPANLQAWCAVRPPVGVAPVSPRK